MPPPSHDRALEIDGIRGWASFSVLLYHAFHEMLSRLVPWVNSPWLEPVFDGRLAVCVFFVLSGDALSTTFLARGGSSPTSIDRLLVRRYTRLTFPILLACTLVLMVRWAHADFHTEATVIIDRPDWLGELIAFPFSVMGMLRYAVLGVYTSHSKSTSYNPFLWTMSVEMLGSMLVFLTCYLWPRLVNPKGVLIFVTLALLAQNSLLSLFFAGMYLGLLRIEGFYGRTMAPPRWQLSTLGIFIGLYLVRVAAAGHQMPLFFDLVSAMAIVFVLYSQRTLRQMLRSRCSTWLGDVSFPLYLVQFAVIISFESWLVTVWSDRRWDSAWLPLIASATVVVAMLVATVFRQVERVGLASLDGWVLRILRRD